MNDRVVTFFSKLANFALKSIAKRIKWNQIFQKAAENVLKLSEGDEDRQNLIKEAFSKDFLSSLSADSKDLSSRTFIQVLIQKTKLNVARFFSDKNECNKIYNDFILFVYSEIEKLCPDFALLIRQEELLVKMNMRFDLVDKQLTNRVKPDDLKELLKQTKNLEQFDAELRKKTAYSFGLDFFDYEDEKLTNDLKNALKYSYIYLTGSNRDESFYCVMQELRKQIANGEKLAQVVIVEYEEIWKKLSINGFSNSIVIPLFKAEEIEPIENNINILFISRTNAYSKSPLVEVRKRTRGNLDRKVKQTFVIKNVDNWCTVADKYYRETHGSFELIKREYFFQESKEPKWLKFDHSELKNIMLVNQWTAQDKDSFEKLTSLSYEKAEKIINKLLHENNAFLYSSHDEFFGVKVSRIKEAWANLAYLITYAEWSQYCEAVLQYLYFHKAVGNEPSLVHKKALIENLIISKDFLDAKKNSVTQVVVKCILNSYDTVESYASFAQIAEIIVEYNPAMFISKIKKDFIRFGSEIKKLDDSFQFIMYALEKTLRIKDYALDCLELLFLMHDLKSQYGLCVHPLESITKALSAWGRHGALSKQKIKIEVKRMIAQYDTAWDVVYGLLPHTHKNFICRIIDPLYIEINQEDIEQRTVSSRDELYNYYIDICIANIKNSTDRLIKILESNDYLYYEHKNQFYEILKSFIDQRDDLTKKKIQDALREAINDKRLYAKQNLDIAESNDLEIVMKSIKYENPVMGYTYLLEYLDYNFPLLNISPLEEDYEQQEVQRAEIRNNTEIFITDSLNEFKNQEYDLCELLDLANINNKQGSPNFKGHYIAKVYSPKGFDLNLFYKLFNYSEKTKVFAFQYLDYCYRKFNCKTAPSIALDLVKNDEDLIQMLRIETIDVNADLLLFKQSTSVVQKFWQTTHPTNITYVIQKETIKYILDQYYQNDRIDCLLWVLSVQTDVLSYVEILDWLVLCIKDKEALSKEWGLFSMVCKALKSNQDKWAALTKVELSIGSNHDFIIAPKWFAMNAQTYAKLANTVFSHKDSSGNVIEAKECYEFTVSHVDFMRLKFCPGCIDGKTVDTAIFDKWIGEFELQLEKQNQEHLFDYLVGRLLVHSAQNEDGHELATVVREYMDKNPSGVKSGFAEEMSIKIGAFYGEEGKGANRIAERLKKEYEFFDNAYPRLAMIYKDISDTYFQASKIDRDSDT